MVRVVVGAMPRPGDDGRIGPVDDQGQQERLGRRQSASLADLFEIAVDRRLRIIDRQHDDIRSGTGAINSIDRDRAAATCRERNEGPSESMSASQCLNPML